MELYEAINRRRTLRDFSDADIDDATVERILSAGMKAPTNDHMRDWHFVVIKDKNVVHRLIQAIPQKVSGEEVSGILKDWRLNDPCQQAAYKDAIPKQYRMLAEASCVIVPLLKQKTDILHPEHLSHLNGFASIWCCIENIFLAATAENYACALRIPLGDEAAWAQQVLDFPADYMMPCFIAVGKPKADATVVKQLDIDVNSRIHYDGW